MNNPFLHLEFTDTINELPPLAEGILIVLDGKILPGSFNPIEFDPNKYRNPLGYFIFDAYLVSDLNLYNGDSILWCKYPTIEQISVITKYK